MNLVSLFSEDNILSDETCYIFVYQSNENRTSRFFCVFLGDSQYKYGAFNLKPFCDIEHANSPRSYCTGIHE